MVHLTTSICSNFMYGKMRGRVMNGGSGQVMISDDLVEQLRAHRWDREPTEWSQ
ncbi:MAG: hypothetical protein M3R24_14565 [Chloroflexota bacterium]|nr:hypothetical protein [Chloroflexota bacterium]